MNPRNPFTSVNFNRFFSFLKTVFPFLKRFAPVIVLLVSFLAWYLFDFSVYHSGFENPRVANVLPATPVSGKIKNYTEEKPLSSLEISVTDSRHYFIVLRDPLTKEWVSTIFVRSGKGADIQVPLGDFEVVVAAGYIWMGESELFGRKTIFYKFDETLSFKNNGKTYTSWKLNLTGKFGGSLKASKISKYDFLS